MELLEQYATAGAEQFREILRSASIAIRNEKANKRIAGGSVNGDFAEIGKFSRLVVVGDLHGDSSTMSQILETIRYSTFLADEANKLIFLGDYIDRGPDSLGVLYTVCALKSAFPNNVILLRGNHESPRQFPFSSHDLPYRIVDKFGPGGAARIYNETLDFFELLTLAVNLRNQMLIVHGGLPVEFGENRVNQIAMASQSYTANRIMEEILWNDPRDLGDRRSEKSRRGFGNHFGKTVTAEWLSETKTRIILRGHEPCRAFRLDHDEKIVTLFSSKAPYPSFEAGYLEIAESELSKCNDGIAVSKFVQKLNG